MPDSELPPLWGPAYDERDLDAVLSGDMASTPVALQPVVSTLAALCAAATGRELADEAAARAAFRAFATAPPPPPPAMAPGTAAAEHLAVPAHTLVLTPADDRRQPAGRRRHRHRRPTPGGARKRGITVTFAAPAALVAVAVTCVLGGVGSTTSSFGRQPASASGSARSARPSPGSQGLLASGATSERTASPKTTAPATAAPRPTSDASSMCRQYFEYFQHPTPGSASGERALDGQRGKLAGSGSSFRTHGYCRRVPRRALSVRPPPPAHRG
jgi:hypothetical protein